jgi:hypothetical protein
MSDLLCEKDTGIWSVDEWRNDVIVLQSSDFTHDVALKISGDFETKEQRIAYAHSIAARLNETKDT